ncbi:WD40 repeat-like protein [Linnemannia elongata AG-77]|uniref:WD40 repeat-like protein n=1 Tax=Linnemannia elongata AG-77 TaxID=1314771 RepID=A0A197JLM2_9FUNG|nr:WD40 repeat-like protein [Linnemannia elongata AG-77]
MRLSDYPVVFTTDSNYFFSCNAKTIRIISVETGQVVRILSASTEEGGHADTVTCVMLNPKNSLQLYSASLDGTIKLWDFNDAILLKTFEVGTPITHMAMHEGAPSDVYLVVTKKSTKRFHKKQMRKSGGLVAKENSILVRYSLKSSRKRIIRLLSSRSCSGLVISSDGEYLVMTGRYKLHVIHIAAGDGIEQGAVSENDESRFRTYLTSNRIAALAFHPTEGCIATGDERGRITLWYCFGKNVDRPVTTSMHWHAHKVASLAFTSDGNYLLSGGEESVLVIWQVSTGHKQFLPRLGSEIKHITISPDDALYAMGHQDNSVNVIRAVDLKIKNSIQGLKLSHTDPINNPLLTGLVVEPRNGHVVLNGLPGTLQFYDPIKDQHIMELEVFPRNKVSRTYEKEIVAPRVMHVAFSNDKSGRWMVTVDGRDDKTTTPELYIKFWEYDDDSHTYVLNTRVDSPHKKEVTSCIFNPRQGNQSPMVVTTSLDGTFKVWELTHQGEARRGVEAERAWSCRSTGFYRDMVPRAAGFASDGSLLAVAYDQIITLWNPYLNTLQGVLTQPPENRPIRHLTFLKNSPFLIAATSDHLYSWNLLTCSVWWSYQLKVDRLVASQTNSNFMVTCSNRVQGAAPQHRIMVFKPTDPKPVRIDTVEKKPRAITFMPDATAAAKDIVEPILIMNHGFAFEILGGRSVEELKAEAEEAAEKARVAALAAETKKSLMSDIFGKTAAMDAAAAAQDKKEKKQQQDTVASRGMVSKKNMVRNPLFDAPSHVMAPVSSLFEAFMGQLLTQGKAAKDEAKARKKALKQQKLEEAQQQAGATGNTADTAIDIDMDDDAVEIVGVKEGEDDAIPSSLAKIFSARLSL